MVQTSNSYVFGQNTEIDDLLTEALEHVGIIGNTATALQIKSAIYSANLELTSWAGRDGNNLFMINPMMVSLVPGQSKYELPSYVVQIPYNEMVVLAPQRLNTGGTAYSSDGGVANNCFDPTATAGCAQTAPNGYISYNYGAGNTNSILYIGILSLSLETYSIAVEYSVDGNTWVTLYNAIQQTYYPSITNWIVLKKSVAAQFWRIRETQGATLQIQQLYFNIDNYNQNYQTLAAVSRFDYLNWSPTVANSGNPNSTQGSTLSGYYVDEGMPTVINVYPVPSTTGFCLKFNALWYPQDITYLFYNAPMPPKFLEAFIKGVAYRLSLKFLIQDKAQQQILKQESIEAYQRAIHSDYQNVILSFMPDMSSFGTLSS
jgi:hypothetical protein